MSAPLRKARFNFNYRLPFRNPIDVEIDIKINRYGRLSLKLFCAFKLWARGYCCTKRRHMLFPWLGTAIFWLKHGIAPMIR